ncbi:glycosyltransferase family 4 protein [Thermococcus sp. JdF3]|uniref:glycosyltransferase family 4 protein n=1 Tax=Thermococcus sp. JdF3 TaxID=1638258 RepID=UPI00143BA83E|nr:glycosyltransferase family 4 protein [Thermococcus sp. JdF3]NJE02073.1 glycosyltransferase family 4 protein [Thermococcus sp. JdF3]
MEEDRNLLIVTNSYPDRDGMYYGGIFVKDQIWYLKRYFKSIYVISPQPWGVNKGLANYEYDNVKVFFPRFFHAPVTYFRKKLGENFFKAALRVIKREKLEFDLIHAHFTWPSGYAGLKLKKVYRVPLVLTTHGLHVTRLNSMKKKHAMETWNSVDAIINVSRKCVELLKELGLPASKLYYVPNGVDLKKFYPIDQFVARETLGVPTNKRVIVSVGNLVEKKGYIYLIQAAKILQELRDDFVVYIVGGGPLYSHLQKEILSLGLKKHVFLVGRKPHDEVALWMNAADVFVLPSLVENFGVVNIEALACGKPVISTYNGGSEEVIISNDYGFLCPPKDPECLAEKILMALNKEWDREKMRKYAEQFSWSKVVHQILGVYNKVLG